MLYKWNHAVYKLWLAFFPHSAQLACDPLKLSNVSIVHSFLMPSSISWYRCTTICLTIYPLMDLKDIWDVFCFWLLQINLLWTFFTGVCMNISCYFSEINVWECSCSSTISWKVYASSCEWILHLWEKTTWVYSCGSLSEFSSSSTNLCVYHSSSAILTTVAI